MDLAALDAWLEASPEAINDRLEDGSTPLYRACCLATGELAIPARPGEDGHHALVDRLLAAGADPAIACADGMTPLHAAAMTSNVRLAQQLLDAGAPRDGRLLGQSGGSPLALALFYAQTAIVRLLADDPVPDNLRLACVLEWPLATYLSAGRPSERGRSGWSFFRPLAAFPDTPPPPDDRTVLTDALTYAARHGATGCMAELLALGADLDHNPYRGTALLWAAYSNQAEAARWLLQHGADPDVRHDFGGAEHGRQAVALHLAAQYGCLDVLRVLLEHGADATIRDAAYDSTPAGWAAHAGQHQAAQILASVRGGRGGRGG